VNGGEEWGGRNKRRLLSETRWDEGGEGRQRGKGRNRRKGVRRRGGSGEVRRIERRKVGGIGGGIRSSGG